MRRSIKALVCCIAFTVVFYMGYLLGVREGYQHGKQIGRTRELIDQGYTVEEIYHILEQRK